MRISTRIQGFSRRPLFVLLLGVTSSVSFSTSVALALPESLTGGIQLNAVTGETNGEERSSLNQRYTLNWSKQLLPYVSGRAAVNYDRFGIESDRTGNSWRQEIQPVAELGWSHPYFTASLTARHRESSNQDALATVVRNYAGVGFRTALYQYPILTIRYDSDEAYNKNDRSARDSYEQRIQTGLNYTISNHTFNYNLTRRLTDLRSTKREVDETAHVFRWDQSTNVFHRRVRLTTGYNFGPRSQINRFQGDSTGLRPFPVAAGLYAEDATPDFGALDTVRTLMDGNAENPVFPEINIGQGVTDQNIGVDLGFARSVEGLYIYTDGPSGTTISWTVYTSQDNLTWDRSPVTTRSTFNPSFNRYEVLFSLGETRYVKAVSGGLNSELSVRITEIEALEEEPTESESRLSQTSHQASATLGIRISQKVRSTVDVLYRGEPASDFSNSREQMYYGSSMRHSPSRLFRHTLTLQSGREKFHGASNDLSSMTLTYAATTTPLETIEFTVSAVDQNGYENDIKQNETKGVSFRGTGTVLPDLDVAFDLGFSRVDQPVAGTRFDSWTYQASIDAGVTRAIDVLSTFSYQSSDAVGTSTLRIRRQVAANVNFRATSTILLRGNVSHSDDDGRDRTSQEYSGTWALGNRMSWSGLLNISESSSAGRTQRITINSNVKVSARTSLTVSYSGNETGGGNETKTHAYQVGIRSGF